MLFEAEKNDEVLLSKKVVLILNKRDLLNDEEILREYKSTLYAELQTFFREKGLAKVEEGLLEANTFVTSAGTYYGVGELLRKFAELLQKSEDNGYHPEAVFDEANYYEEYEEEPAPASKPPKVKSRAILKLWKADLQKYGWSRIVRSVRWSLLSLDEMIRLNSIFDSKCRAKDFWIFWRLKG